LTAEPVIAIARKCENRALQQLQRFIIGNIFCALHPLSLPLFWRAHRQPGSFCEKILALKSMGLIGVRSCQARMVARDDDERVDNAERFTTPEVEPFLRERNHT
jgi:hypothetical protein